MNEKVMKRMRASANASLNTNTSMAH